MTSPPLPVGEGAVRVRVGHSRALGERLGPGASLAVSGVCLTVTDPGPEEAAMELSPETLSRTTLGGLREGSQVNLEPALRLGDPLGGHWVQGHVDATLDVLERRDLGEHRELVFALPAVYRPYVVEKGSVTLDGVSLTVSRLQGDPGCETGFAVALVPHTLAVTTLSGLEVGDRVNFEADVLAKYVARAALVARAAEEG